MEQFEQLLTCAICLDRYRNPKLLPCQHSFCMEPCMDGLVDYVRRQVKCPECRAEHRIPYQGVQGYPTNVTLQRFLELHIEITGELPDPTSGQIMERCNVCSEKSYCSMCVHCDKKICADCKGAHMDILRREISRINNQIRRGLHRLQDMLAIVEKNMLSLQTNTASVSEEVDEINRRLSKALKDRTEFLRGEIDKYLSTEIKNLSTLKENLEQEISNIQSNCDLADKHMTEAVEWDDCELMDAKEIFLKTVEFIRNFECENTDYNRRMRFAMAHDPNQLVLHVAGYGELTVHTPHQPFANNPQGIVGSGSSTNLLQAPGPGLMRSKSDHRLTSQFRQQEERGYDRYGDPEESTGPPRKFGERYSRPAPTSSYGDRYGRQDYGSEFESPYDSEPRRSSYRSRFRRDRDVDSDTDTQVRSVRFTEPQHKERERVLDTEDVARGPLSGITRLYDSPRVMQRIAEIGKEKKKPEPKPEPPTPKFQPPKKAQRQISEEDEISRIKKQNKQGGSESQERPALERVQALKRGGSDGEDRSSPSSPREETSSRKTPPVAEVPSSEGETEDEEEEEEETVPSLQKPAAKSTPSTAATTSGTASRRSSTSSDLPTPVHKKAGRSASSDSTTSTESSHGTSALKSTGAAYTTEEVKQKILARGSVDKGSEGGSGSSTPRGRLSSTGSETSKKEVPGTPTKFQSRFLKTEKPKPTKEEDEETESSSETETDTEEESEDDKRKADKADMDKTDIGPLLARSAHARDTTSTRRDSVDDTAATGYRSRYGPNYTRDPPKEEVPWRTRYGHVSTRDDDPPPTRSRYGHDRDEAPRFLTRNRQTQEEDSKVGGYTSRFLNKSKSTATVSPDEDSDRAGSRKYSIGTDEDSKYSTGRSRYSALKDRRNSITKSRSTHSFANPDDDDDEDLSSHSSYLQSKYGTPAGNDLARSRSTHHLKSRESSPDRPNPGREKDGAALSSWARYLKNKYGNRGKDGKDAAGTAPASSAGASTSSLNSRRLSLGLPLRHNSTSFESSDDDQKNTLGSPTSPTATAAAAGFVAAAAGSTLRNQYMQKRRQQFKIGSRGSEPGCFTWPRGIAVGSDNSIVVADSSNHRVQVFDANGNFTKEFGTYGNGEGEFDCLAGVAVNRIGQFIIADRYNHRIQVLDPSGRFLRAFGSQGTGDGRFNYPWGITTDALGFIYVCDKENHRVQVFQSDGTFVGKFGSHGNKPGQLEHPHYIAVSNTNRVIVSDSNNHRVQIFDVNGRVLSSFGNEGSEEGQFKFPRNEDSNTESLCTEAVNDILEETPADNSRREEYAPRGQFCAPNDLLTTVPNVNFSERNALHLDHRSQSRLGALDDSPTALPRIYFSNENDKKLPSSDEPPRSRFGLPDDLSQSLPRVSSSGTNVKKFSTLDGTPRVRYGVTKDSSSFLPNVSPATTYDKKFPTFDDTFRSRFDVMNDSSTSLPRVSLSDLYEKKFPTVENTPRLRYGALDDSPISLSRLSVADSQNSKFPTLEDTSRKPCTTLNDFSMALPRVIHSDICDKKFPSLEDPPRGSFGVLCDSPTLSTRIPPTEICDSKVIKGSASDEVPRTPYSILDDIPAPLQRVPLSEILSSKPPMGRGEEAEPSDVRLTESVVAPHNFARDYDNPDAELVNPLLVEYLRRKSVAPPSRMRERHNPPRNHPVSHDASLMTENRTFLHEMGHAVPWRPPIDHNHHHQPLPNDVGQLSNLGISHRPPLEGSGSGRSRVHIRGGFGQQPDPNLPPGWNIPEGVRVLGLERRGVQGSGGSGGHEQRKHFGLRPREPPHSSFLASSSLTTCRSFDGSLPPFPTTLPPRTFHSLSTPHYNRCLQRPRSTLF